MNSKPPEFFCHGQVHNFVSVESDICFVCLCVDVLTCAAVSVHVCAHKHVWTNACGHQGWCQLSSLACFGSWSSLVWLDWPASKSSSPPPQQWACRHNQLFMWVPGIPTQVLGLCSNYLTTQPVSQSTFLSGKKWALGPFRLTWSTSGGGWCRSEQAPCLSQ